jgi:hypothetical protein
MPRGNPGGYGIGHPSKLGRQVGNTPLDRAGRFGDTTVGHLTPGEVVIPRRIAEQVESPLRQILGQRFGEFQVGGLDDKINPITGRKEFFHDIDEGGAAGSGGAFGPGGSASLDVGPGDEQGEADSSYEVMRNDFLQAPSLDFLVPEGGTATNISRGLGRAPTNIDTNLSESPDGPSRSREWAEGRGQFPDLTSRVDPYGLGAADQKMAAGSGFAPWGAEYLGNWWDDPAQIEKEYVPQGPSSRPSVQAVPRERAFLDSEWESPWLGAEGGLRDRTFIPARPRGRQDPDAEWDPITSEGRGGFPGLGEGPAPNYGVGAVPADAGVFNTRPLGAPNEWDDYRLQGPTGLTRPGQWLETDPPDDSSFLKSAARYLEKPENIARIAAAPIPFATTAMEVARNLVANARKFNVDNDLFFGDPDFRPVVTGEGAMADAYEAMLRDTRRGGQKAINLMSRGGPDNWKLGREIGSEFAERFPGLEGEDPGPQPFNFNRFFNQSARPVATAEAPIESPVNTLAGSRQGFFNEINEAFPGDAFQSVDNEILNSLLNERQSGASGRVARASARGNLNEAGSFAANQNLSQQADDARTRLGDISLGVRGQNQRAIDEIRSRAFDAAGRFQPGDSPFDITPFVTERQNLIGDLQGSFREDITTALGGERLFNPFDAINVGGSAQGAVSGAQPNLAFLDRIAAREGLTGRSVRDRRGLGTRGSGVF